MNEYNLSEFFISLKDDPRNIKISSASEKCGWLESVNELNNGKFLKFAGEDLTGNVSVLPQMSIFAREIDYVIAFLEMCESLFNGKQPIINRFNEARLRQMEEKTIVSLLKGKGEILHTNIVNLNLLQDEYFNIRYKTNNNNVLNTQNITTDNSLTITNSTVNGSNIQVNCNVAEKDLSEIVQVIQMLISMNPNVPQEFKNDISNNADDKNKLGENLKKFSKWLVTNCAIAQINASVPILTNIAVQAITKFNI